MIKFKLIGADKLKYALSSKDTVGSPMRSGISKLTLKMEALTKRATVVDTGRLRASITHSITQRSGLVGTNVKYAEFVEYGHHARGNGKFVEARHAEPGSPRVLGKGMFTYALEQLKTWIDKIGDEIAKEIEGRFS